MAAIVYPLTLPGPSVSAVTPAERRGLSDLPGPRQVRSLWRDYLGTQQIEWDVLTADEANELHTWWRNVLTEGGAWFASIWPAPQGWVSLTRRFIGTPKWLHLPGGLWRVSATVLVRGRGMPPQTPTYPCGVLCHFDMMAGGEVVSAIGPNFVPDGGADLSGPAPAFGTAGNGIFTASGIGCTNNTSWRAEGRFYFPDANSGGGLFELGSGGSYPTPRVRLRVSLHGMYADTTTLGGTASQLLGAYYVPSAIRIHAGVQYCCDPTDPDYRRLFWFAAGERQGEITLPGGAIDHFESTSFGTVSLQNPDEFWLQYGLRTSKLYRATYTVPTAPFAPADPA